MFTASDDEDSSRGAHSLLEVESALTTDEDQGVDSINGPDGMHLCCDSIKEWSIT